MSTSKKKIPKKLHIMCNFLYNKIMAVNNEKIYEKRKWPFIFCLKQNPDFIVLSSLLTSAFGFPSHLSFRIPVVFVLEFVCVSPSTEQFCTCKICLILIIKENRIMSHI